MHPPPLSHFYVHAMYTFIKVFLDFMSQERVDSTLILVTLYRRGVLSLHKSSGIDDIGGIKWQIAGCGVLTFTILYLSLWKSVKSAGKVFVTKQQMFQFKGFSF